MTAILPRSTSTRDTERYLRVLAGPSPNGRLLEIRCARPGGHMGQHFLPAQHPDPAARLIRALAPRSDVYTGVLLRARRAGNRHAVTGSHLAFIEIDHPRAYKRLERFPHPPGMIIASGTPGHLHAYWTLQHPADIDELERANRRLAHHLGGDLASLDAARILRPPASWNHKHNPPTPVALLALHPGRVRLQQLTDGLPDPPGNPPRPAASPNGRRARHPLDAALLALPARHWALMLAGLEASRAGKIPCPFHHLSVGRAVAAGVSPARSPVDASLTDRGGPR